MRKILFVVNPRSGVDRKKDLQRLIDGHLDRKQFHYSIAVTQYAGHGTSLAGEAIAEGVDLIAVVGGDGSVNDVVQAALGTDIPLALIPMGSGNGLARSLGIPLKPKKAVELINRGRTATIDVGKINDRYFVSNAGVGFDAVITNAFRTSRSRGFKAYMALIQKHLWHYRPLRYALEIDGAALEEEAFMVTVANGMQLGYGFKIAPTADLTDGVFDVIILKKFKKALALSLALRAFGGKILKSRYVLHQRARTITIRHPDLVFYQYDGEAERAVHPSVSIRMSTNKLPIIIP